MKHAADADAGFVVGIQDSSIPFDVSMLEVADADASSLVRRHSLLYSSEV